MGYYCTVPQCTSLAGKTKNVKFHRFPRDIPMADKWNVILKRGKPYTKYSKVCSLHFTQADYNVTTMGQWKTLSKDAVPSQNLPKLNPDGTVMVIRKSRTVKYRETRKEDGEKEHKWLLPTPHTPALTNLDTVHEPQDSNLAYRLQTLSAIASNMPPQPPLQPSPSKPKKQDAIMQTDPVQSEEDETQPNNSYSEASDTSFNSEQLEYPVQYKDNQKKPETDYSYKEKEYSIKTYEQQPKRFDSPKDYTKDDYIPQTNEEYNKEAEKYALERKSLSNYEKIDTAFQKPVVGTEYEKEAEKYILERKSHYEKLDGYPKPVTENGYQKLPDVYAFNDGKEYQTRNDYVGYQNGYPDSVDVLRNQQHNIQMLQEQHRVSENQNFFNDNPIKQEILNEEDKFLYERTKEQLDATALYGGHRSLTQQQRLLEHLQHQVKQEPDASGSDSVMQPQGSPYYAANGHTNAAGYYEQISRPGPELLIAKQNALAAHTQLWHNTMKRPFFYSETSHYSAPQLLHRYTTEDLTRILQ